MALQRFSIEVAGEKQYARAFDALASEVEDLSEPLAEIGEMLRHDVAEQFLTEGGAGSYGKWKMLNPDYERAKRAAGFDGGILVRTGDMFAAATDRRAVTVTPKRMVYEIDDPKAAYHQTGAGSLPDDPPRRIVDLSMEDRRAIDRVFASWLQRVRRGPLWS